MSQQNRKSGSTDVQGGWGGADPSSEPGRSQPKTVNPPKDALPLSLPDEANPPLPDQPLFAGGISQIGTSDVPSTPSSEGSGSLYAERFTPVEVITREDILLLSSAFIQAGQRFLETCDNWKELREFMKDMSVYLGIADKEKDLVAKKNSQGEGNITREVLVTSDSVIGKLLNDLSARKGENDE